MTISRRDFLAAGPGVLAGLAGLGACAGVRGDGRARALRRAIAAIEREILWNGRAGGPGWFHPRPCRLGEPRDPPAVLMTMQTIEGSDVFGPVHWTRTDDLGRTWSDPAPIPALGPEAAPGGLVRGVSDVVPDVHPGSGRVLALGHDLFWRDGVLVRPQPPRVPVYCVGDGRGAWGPRRVLEWDEPEAGAIYTAGCGQRVWVGADELLVAVSYGPPGRPDRRVTALRCGFDGERLQVLARGGELRLPVRRGLLEPSLAAFGGLYWMTLRAEDGHGYVTASRDGLAYDPIRPWCFEDGEALVMSTTQQHWLATAHGLFLVYTRLDDTNARVMRHRAPLYLAEVDPERRCLVRATERVVLPYRGDPLAAPEDIARMGNFHTLAVTPEEAWVVAGEARPAAGWAGDTLLARIRWDVPLAT